MKILRLVKDLFGDVAFEAGITDIKNIFQKQREKYDDDGRFFNCIIQYLGGRGYNDFLDYSLFAIKMHLILAPYWWRNFGEENYPGDENPCTDIVTDLLFDDRHDLWQNMPYCLDDIHKALTNEESVDMWKRIVDAIIECINVKGTGDVSVNFVVKE